MLGRGAERFCDTCRTQVHDLSQMTEVQARLFLAQRGGQRVCVRYQADGAGNLQFRPAPPRRGLVLAVASLALAACTGYVESDTLESPDDALACEDASGYTIPCEDTIAPPPPADVITHRGPEPTEPVVEPTEPVTDTMGDVEIPDPDADIFLGQMVADPNAAAEGCPVPQPDVDDGGVVMGELPVEPTSRLKRKRLERQWKREQRRQARRVRRSGGA